MALRCRRAGAVHSIISGQSASGQMIVYVRFAPESGHQPTRQPCRVCAISGYMQRQMIDLARPHVPILAFLTGRADGKQEGCSTEVPTRNGRVKLADCGTALRRLRRREQHLDLLPGYNAPRSRKGDYDGEAHWPGAGSHLRRPRQLKHQLCGRGAD
jgi:hypothetical protein